MIDEAKAHDLFIDCSLSKGVLQQWVSDWAGESLGDFAEKVLDMLEVRSCSPYAVAEHVAGLSDKDLRVLSRQCARYRVRYERIDRGATDKDTKRVLANHAVQFDNGKLAYVAVDFDAYYTLQDKGLPTLQPQGVSDKGYLVLTPAQTFALGVYESDNLDSISALPRLYEQSNYTPFQQLKAFIDRYKREVDAPIWYTDGVLHWVIPPVVHSRVKHLVCMSATLQKEGFERAFDNVKTTFVETSPTHWVDGTRAFQVRTGAYPRASLLDYDTDWQPVGLSSTGKRFIGLIEKEVERDRDVKHVLITFNAIIDFCGESLSEKHKNLDVLSFHKMEGLDYTDSGMVFWILGCPDVSSAVLEQRARVLFGNDREALIYDRNDSREYVDSRVHLCWLSEVMGRLQQAVGRARLNRLANTVVVFSNVLIPDFTDRAVGFVPEDLEVAGELSSLVEVSAARQKAEQESEHKTARQKLQDERKTARDIKAEQKAEVYRLYNSGVPPSEIVKRGGVSRRTIYRCLEAIKF